MTKRKLNLITILFIIGRILKNNKDELWLLYRKMFILLIFLLMLNYIAYSKYNNGYIASDMSTCNTINYAIEQILLSENNEEKKKELIEKLCYYSYSEICVINLSNNTMFYEKECPFQNKKLFKERVLSVQTIKVNDEYYSIKYTTYIPKFYTTVRYRLFLGKHMVRI